MGYRILLVDDDRLSLRSTRMLLEKHGFLVDAVASGDEAVQLVRERALEGGSGYALVLLDYQMQEKDGAQTAQALLSISPELFILIYSGDDSRDALKGSWKAGAVDFIEKGAETSLFLSVVRSWCTKFDKTVRALDAFQFNRDENWLPTLNLVGCSAALRAIERKVRLYRESTENVLILGETGTGKELVARALHDEERGPFLAVNCASYRGGTDLLESELFGHEKGAFTGAERDKAGILETARGGTVFLDEVHHLSLTAQAKLLRAFQEKRIRRVGGVKEHDVDFRLVTAAKPNLEALCDSGDFLRDLYHRLDVLSLSIPPLKNRPEDVEPLVAHFCRKFAERTGKRRTFSMQAVRHLSGYAWPGNVRELENMVYRLLTECPGEKVEPQQLDAKVFSPSEEVAVTTYEALKSRMEREERRYVEHAIRTAGSKIRAAERLGISPSTLHSIMKRVGLYRTEGDGNVRA